jgi:hypothetical protein
MSLQQTYGNLYVTSVELKWVRRLRAMFCMAEETEEQALRRIGKARKEAKDQIAKKAEERNKASGVTWYFYASIDLTGDLLELLLRLFTSASIWVAALALVLVLTDSETDKKRRKQLFIAAIVSSVLQICLDIYGTVKSAGLFACTSVRECTRGGFVCILVSCLYISCRLIARG